VSRNWHPATLALLRAALTVKPVIRGTWHDVRADAEATLDVPVTVNGRKVTNPIAAIHEPRDRFIITPYLADTTIDGR
jgi:hypothetical protein